MTKEKPSKSNRKNWPALKPRMMAIDDVRLNPRNVNTHDQFQIADLAKSLKEFGWTKPLLIDEEGVLIAGEGRYLAAKKNGDTEVPVASTKGWTDAEKRAYAIIDNQLGKRSEFDVDFLAVEISDLGLEGFSSEFLGFSEKDELLSKEISVKEIETSLIEDTFWISIKGPLKKQAEALQKLKAFMKDHPDVTVELGTINDLWS